MNQPLRLLAVCNYPSDTQPAHQVFVRALLIQIASLGVQVTVVAPEPVWNLLRARTGHRLSPTQERRDGLLVYRPRYLTYSNVALPLGGTTSRWTTDAYVRAVMREAGKWKGSFDVCFAHFLYPHGAAALELGHILGIPSVVSLGESSFGRYESTYTQPEIRRLLEQFSGVIANSSGIQHYCHWTFGLTMDKTRVFPNGVNERIFYPRDRGRARALCHLPADRPIVIFTGQFIDRKGPLRVLEAIRSRPEIGAVFLGYGPQMPEGPQVLFRGEVPHEEVPIWLSAADLFVLPTLNEGCSNSILEALMCGLPVISSNLPFNEGILDEQVSVLINPRDVGALEQALGSVLDSPERKAAMSQAALRRSQSFHLAERTRNVLGFLNELCKTEGRAYGNFAATIQAD